MNKPLRQLCTFLIDDLLFGVDVGSVQEVIRYQPMTKVPLAPPAVSGLINLRGQIVTALDLRERLAFPSRPGDIPPMNVVVKCDDDVVSLLVDEIGDVVEVSADAFELPPATLRGPARLLIEGAYKLSNGLLLVLNTLEAVSMAGHDSLPVTV